MIQDDGYLKHCIWEHSQTVRELYRRRCCLEEEEMTCAAQAAELLRPHVAPGDVILDAGCGSGYFYHSLRKRQIPGVYYGIDAAPSLIEIGRRYLPPHGLPADRLRVVRLEDLRAEVDHVVCLNVLSNIDNYCRPLERLLRSTRKTVVLRESCQEVAEYRYVRDRYLDPGVELNVHVNAYAASDFKAFIQARGFDVTQIEDWRTGGKAELVIGYEHYWTFFFCQRRL